MENAALKISHKCCFCCCFFLIYSVSRIQSVYIVILSWCSHLHKYIYSCRFIRHVVIRMLLRSKTFVRDAFLRYISILRIRPGHSVALTWNTRSSRLPDVRILFMFPESNHKDLRKLFHTGAHAEAYHITVYIIAMI